MLLAIMIQSFVSMGWTTVIWLRIRLAPSLHGDWHGDRQSALRPLLRNIFAQQGPSPANDSIPLFVYVAYQMNVCHHHPGAHLRRIRKPCHLQGLLLFPNRMAHLLSTSVRAMIWGGGFLQRWGVLDFAGGIVVHNIAAVAALASVLYVAGGACSTAVRTAFPWLPSATGLLWFGLVRLQLRQRVFGGRSHRERPFSTPTWRFLCRCHLAGRSVAQ